MVSVIVVGAGAAGLTAAWHLQEQSSTSAAWTVKVLEASSDRIGGRIRKDDQAFAGNVAIDVGAEWIHGPPAQILNPILDRDVVTELGSNRIVAHQYGQVSVWDGQEFYQENPDFGIGDHKWVDYTWFDFFNNQVASEFNSNVVDIVLNCPVTEIAYSYTITTNGSSVTCQNGDTYQADYVLVTVSMQQLQSNRIQFTPVLPDNYRNAIASFQMEPAIKVFLEFDVQFYPAVWVVERDWQDFSLDESSANYADRVYYDARFGQSSTSNQTPLIGVFIYGAIARQYLETSPTGDVLLDTILSELDVMFAGQATAHFVMGKVQNWVDVPYIETGYTRWVDPESAIGVLQTPLHHRLWFAGEALPVDQENWGFAHGAALSGKQAAQQIVQHANSGHGGNNNNTSGGGWFAAILAVLAAIFPCLV